ncbi:MAG TPA: hypothetical protein VFV49_03505 [Thermoanaerobaculia bacterium]|nr:hypothetical protein [Thermoanaerobaculia bacterium]
MNRLTRFALLLSLALIASEARAVVRPPADPDLDTLLKVQPIVVIAKVDDGTRTSKKTFPAIGGDFDRSPARTEEYRHYRLRTVRLLKGKLPESFEVRVIRGDRNDASLEKARGSELLLVLAPDSGLDEQGRRRESFLITHGAVFPARDGRFEVVRDGTTETWTIERTADAITRAEKDLERRRAESPEPANAATAVIAGEEKNIGPEREPPAAPTLRPGKVLSAEELAKAAPRTMKSAEGDPDSSGQASDRVFASAIRLGRALEIPARRIPSGDVAGHACLRGDYTHRYEMNGPFGREVWLCCVPTAEILRESFRCAGSFFPTLFGNANDQKIRHCSLLHPTATEPTFIPVCIQAPLQAPGLGPR